MNRFENDAPPSKGDGGRFFPLFSTPEELNRRRGEKEVLKGGGYEKVAPPVPRPLSLEALAEADGPPFHSRETLVRFLATTWPAHMLALPFRRAAARDPKLEWRAGTGRYGYRIPVVAPEAAAGECASPVQYVGSAAAAANAPASPRGDLDGADREGGGLKSSCASTSPTGGTPECECKQPKWRSL